MMDFLGMFGRRPVKRGKQGFGRPRADITTIQESLEDLLPHAVRDAPPIARETPMPGYNAPRSPEPGANVRPPQDRPRQRPQPAARPAKTNNGSAAIQLLRRPGFLAVHSVEKS